MNHVLSLQKKEAVECLIDEAKLWEKQLKFVVEREATFSSRVGGQIEDFNHHIAKIQEDVKICKTNLLDLRSQHDSWKNDLAESKEKLKKQKKQNNAEIERLVREEQDSAKWTSEVEKMSQRRKRVTKLFKDDLVAKKMAKEAREQDMKRALLQAKKEQEEKRLKPFREAATKIYNLTGIKDIDLILETFETWEGKQENMKDMIEQKEEQIENYHDEVSRLKRLLNQSKVIGKQSGDQKRLGTDVYTSKLTEAIAEANNGRSRARTKFLAKRDALIGLSTAAKKLFMDVNLPKLKEEELAQFVMPKKSRRRSIVTRPAEKISKYDKARELEEIAYAKDLLEKIRKGVEPILEELIPKLRQIAKSKNCLPSGGIDRLDEMAEERKRSIDTVKILNAHEDNKSTASTDSKRTKEKRDSKAPSRITSSASLGQRSAKSEESVDDDKEKFTTQDFTILNEQIRELSPTKSAENTRISARKVIVSEYFDYGQGKVQYYYEYISDDENKESEKEDETDVTLAKTHSVHRQGDTDEWKNRRKESKERAISIADIYKKQSSETTDMDPTRYLLDYQDSNFSAHQNLEEEFQNLHTESDFSRHALHYEDDVVNLSKVARRQSSAWKKKQSAKKREKDLMDSAKHHSNSARKRKV